MCIEIIGSMYMMLPGILHLFSLLSLHDVRTPRYSATPEWCPFDVKPNEPG
jgi:hypothetical protein